ncbi:hypothetical protein BRC81_00165 [Halobacteriales archaeon QS_1_68_20]|nr:MAG: hypothetical protein BRC81_00165 [Halobacteriales archaeon QS_1_68_20]
MTGDTRADDGPTLGEQAIVQTIADTPGPLFDEREDGLDGRGDEHPQAMAQAHVYRLLTGKSFFELERQLKRYPEIRETLGFDDVLDHSTFSYSIREQFGSEVYFDSYAEYIRDELDSLPKEIIEPHLAPLETEECDETLPEIPEGAIDRKTRHVRDLFLAAPTVRPRRRVRV